jgi:hypothetical protein
MYQNNPVLKYKKINFNFFYETLYVPQFILVGLIQ